MSNLKNAIVYTCVTNGYDQLQSIDIEAEGIDFVCFTDRLDKVPNGWRTLPLQSPPRLQNGHDINRFHKSFPHHLFPDHRYSIYVDGNVEYLGDYVELIENFKKTGRALGAFRHPNMHNPVSEVDACWRWIKFDKHDLDRSKEQIRAYKDSGFDVSRVIAANYFLVRDHQHPHIRSAMSLWWSHLFEYTKRDQISLNFSLWKENAPFIFLDDIEGVDAAKLHRRSHKRNIIKRLHIKVKKIARSYWRILEGRNDSR